MTSSSPLSVTQQLRHLRHRHNSSSNDDVDDDGDSVLFFRQPAASSALSDIADKKRQHQHQKEGQPHEHEHEHEHHRLMTYKQCWQIVAEHERWLQTTIHDQKQKQHASTDAVIGYLADNSPDLLLSVLACMNLTITTSAGSGGGAQEAVTKVLPAMINVRWTPHEMERALRPSHDCSNNENDRQHHVTIVLYGLGYERAAKEAVRLMNLRSTNQNNDGNRTAASHCAVALSLPELAGKYYTNSKNDNNNASSYASESRMKTNSHGQMQDLKGPSTNNNHPINTPSSLDHNDATSNTDALLLFTSGTSSPTGGAKGVRLSHRSLLVQAHAKTQQPCMYNDRTSVVATTVPWFHVGGVSSALAVILGGGCLVFPSMMEEEECNDCNNSDCDGVNVSDGGVSVKKKGFQPERVLQSIRPFSSAGDCTAASIAANTLVVVPAMLHAIVEYTQQNHNPASLSFPNVRLILVGGQSIGSGRLYQQTRQLFPKARIVQTYACTEAGSSITLEDLGWESNSSDDHHNDNSPLDNNGATCVGFPPPHIQIGIFDANKTNSSSSSSFLLPHGKMGIIGTRGPHVMSGYWNRGNDVVSKNPNNNNGDDYWMFTNDLGYIHPQSGKLFFCGRANDVIRTGGESVLATEVERILDTHDDIVECAVFALPDEKFGEAVCAAIVLKKALIVTTRGAVVVEEEEDDEQQWMKKIRQYCAEHQLAGFKRPRRVFCVRALPRNSSGKVLKHAIIRLCASQSKETSRL
eukprot:CAMPEP_0172316188 /NCGR_PEP_ID=MMETSP1058-20130122/27500_1 /TAXON_ID=83371 /ORGANISM="Detonula confervacea, Strain CCMP 353" /LENGTH=749 /DNA_ID=CAMNT_0013030445 /DNA_START=159 /DNA_END=2408 /DNA_ORIENTATION=+